MAKNGKITRELINAILSVPEINKDYMCHGEVHFFAEPDLLAIEDKINKLFIIQRVPTTEQENK